MMRKLSAWLLGLLVATAVSACCGSVSCECDDTLEDAIYFQFNLADSLGATGFRSADVDTVVVVRYPYVDPLVQLPPNAPVVPNDTTRIIRSRALTAKPIVLNTTAPFTAGGGRKLDAYKYQLYVVRHFPGTATPPETIFYSLDSITLAGRFLGDGCCTCYQNEGKKLRVTRAEKPSTTGTIVDVTTAQNEEPKPVVLSR
ncbi:hypothetical protein SAMN00120144_0601 [Hymenobacter roseosalivarius DSM 11622]|uniref:Lipoprotein n=1 Tax=Hymenobacter roseosalivarius DSM 11622 TaxID=645990 RepID=A0A1W1VC41_9BACT|nr:hypothetical protein [Hymenobacter roseosalivarius]SMB90928.1 hypothetical protein SAMN00120144_0601 [Hymenobacter roseosalivarius DSM 11622]